VSDFHGSLFVLEPYAVAMHTPDYARIKIMMMIVTAMEEYHE